VSSLIDSLEPVQKIDAEIAENARLQQVYAEGHARQVDEFHAAIARRETDVADALGRGALPPDRPPEPASAAEHADRLVWFANRASMLRERRLAAVAAGKPVIDLQTSAAYHDLIDQAGRPVAVLKKIAAQIAELQNTRFEALCAQIATDPTRGMGASRPPSPARPDAEAVVTAATRGLNRLETEPERRLGMVSNLHEIQSQPPPEPKPGQPVQRTSATLGMRQPYGPGR
jgi:hypothetical protein